MSNLCRIGATLLTLSALSTVVEPARAEGVVVQLDLDGPVGVATAEYIVEGIEEAEARHANLVILRMDTPGGLVEPMRDIVQAILGSEVPVVTYVAPGGARAASAGTYILLASHVAAMAPTTHLGAATPVSLGGEPPEAPKSLQPPPAGPPQDGAGPPEPDSAMERKVLNDAVSYIRSLAATHGRNADWAEKAVRDAATLTAREALEQNVIDLIAPDRDALLKAIDGREVKVGNRTVTLDTESVTVEKIEPSWRNRFLTTITNPEIALLLLMVGIYGLIFEGFHPGAVVPGVVGAICLFLAAYALQVIPINFAGLALIVLGFVLIIAETFVPSFGALGLGGIAAFIFGAIMMFDSGVPGFGISIIFVVVFAAAIGLSLLFIVSYAIRLRKRGAVTGRGSIVGGTGTAMEDFSREGRVWLEGEAWHAISQTPVRKDQDVVVRALEGLTLHVEPISIQNGTRNDTRNDSQQQPQT